MHGNCTRLAKHRAVCAHDIQYSSIVLSGIVKSGKDPITTELSVAFEFFTPYFTRDGQPATLMVGCGHDVSVNMILGVPFCQATQAVIDFNDMVVDCKGLDCAPFPMVGQKAQLSCPAVHHARTSVNYNEYKHFLKDLDDLEERWASVHALCQVSGDSKTKDPFHPMPKRGLTFLEPTPAVTKRSCWQPPRDVQTDATEPGDYVALRDSVEKEYEGKGAGTGARGDSSECAMSNV